MALSGHGMKTELLAYVLGTGTGMEMEKSLFCLSGYSPAGKVSKGTTVCPPDPTSQCNGSRERPYQNSDPLGPGVKGR